MMASEFPEVDYPGHQVAIAHKQQVCDRLAELARAAGIHKAEELSAALLILLDGAFAQRRLLQKHGHGVMLQQAARVMIEAYAANID